MNYFIKIVLAIFLSTNIQAELNYQDRAADYALKDWPAKIGTFFKESAGRLKTLFNSDKLTCENLKTHDKGNLTSWFREDVKVLLKEVAEDEKNTQCSDDKFSGLFSEKRKAWCQDGIDKKLTAKIAQLDKLSCLAIVDCSLFEKFSTWEDLSQKYNPQEICPPSNSKCITRVKNFYNEIKSSCFFE